MWQLAWGVLTNVALFGAGTPAPPPGYAFLVDIEGRYLVDIEGRFLLVVV